jgi:CRP/FNR family transcriptional regulator, cyclic AMP receptor protein
MLSDSEKKTVIPMLQDVPLFSSLDKKALGRIANSSTKRAFKEGEVITKEGEIGVTFYLILNGSVEVRRGKRVLAKLGRREFFGEMALFDNQPRSADVVATSETTCILLTSWDLMGVISANPKIAQRVIAELARRLRETNKSLSE